MVRGGKSPRHCSARARARTRVGVWVWVRVRGGGGAGQTLPLRTRQTALSPPYYSPPLLPCRLQPPGHVHAMIASTWADRAVSVVVDGQPGELAPLPVGAALSADSRSLVIRAVNAYNTTVTASVRLLGAVLRAGANGTSSVLSAPALHADNTPTAPNAVAPVAGTIAAPAAGDPLDLTLPPLSFTVVIFPLA